jgi:hypothetical protein
MCTTRFEFCDLSPQGVRVDFVRLGESPKQLNQQTRHGRLDLLIRRIVGEAENPAQEAAREGRGWIRHTG